LLDDIIRPAYFVPENASVSSILREFKKGRQHMAIAVDEYGTTVGLVTIEDLVEEIVGEIYDEYDVEEKKIIQMPDSSWMVFGDETITNINEKLGLKLYSQDIITINGLIMTKLGRIPNTGETLQIGDLKIEIIESNNRRIKKLKINVH
jgi:CBS domain containing-hemolysin-like protein